MKLVLHLWIGLIPLVFATPSFALSEVLISAQDSYLRETSPDINYGLETILLANGVSRDPGNREYGELIPIFKWDVSSVPANSIIKGVSVTTESREFSFDSFHFFSQNSSWSEDTVTWNDLDPGINILGTLKPISPDRIYSEFTTIFNEKGIQLIQGWIDGSIPNNGIILRSAGSDDGIHIFPREVNRYAPTLNIIYELPIKPPSLKSLLYEIIQLKTLLAGVRRQGNTIIHEGVNVQIVSGRGATNGSSEDPEKIGNIISSNILDGRGNVIVGYNEKIYRPEPYAKLGYHNLVIGHGHNYSSYGGLVVGQDNSITGSYSSVSGGQGNKAKLTHSSVSGGLENTSSTEVSNISGGAQNTTNDYIGGSVNGGLSNNSRGFYSNIIGGSKNVAQFGSSTVSGGFRNYSQKGSNVSGGYLNRAEDSFSSVAGGGFNNAANTYSHVDGGTSNRASAHMSTVSGGYRRTAPEENDWVAGSLFEDE